MKARRPHLPPRKQASWTAIVALVLAMLAAGIMFYLLVGYQQEQQQQARNTARLRDIRNDQISEIHRQICAVIAALPVRDPAGLQQFERTIACPVTRPVPEPAPTLSPSPTPSLPGPR